MTHRAFAAIPVAVMLLGAAAGSAPAQHAVVEAQPSRGRYDRGPKQAVNYVALKP
jgi:hypothetical protein